MKNSYRNFFKRKNSAHKGDFGKVIVIAGSKGMSGAVSLAGIAALRSGAGLVSVAVPDAIYSKCLLQDFELMVKPFPSTSSGSLQLKSFLSLSKLIEKQDVLAIGPGLSRHKSTEKLVHKIILSSKIPTVIDADALNAIEGIPEILLKAKAPLFLTPHVKEFQRVFGLKLDLKQATQAKKKVSFFAKKYGVYLILKGHRSIVAAPTGKVFVNSTGNPGMATAGSGDVLTGMLAGLLGLGHDPFKTASLAVYAHGLAGDFAAKKVGQMSLIARDLLDAIAPAFKQISNKS